MPNAIREVVNNEINNENKEFNLKKIKYMNVVKKRQLKVIYDYILVPIFYQTNIDILVYNIWFYFGFVVVLYCVFAPNGAYADLRLLTPCHVLFRQ